MKFLQDERLAAITACLTEIHPINHGLGSSSSKSHHHSMSDRTLFGRLEAYTTKRARMEKLMAQSISERYWNTEECEEGPKTTKSRSKRARARSQSMSSVLKKPSIKSGGRLRSVSFDVGKSSRRRRQKPSGIWCRRTYTDLILTLQASFPDYDFDNVKPHYFVSLNVRLALTRIQEKLADYNNSMDMDTLSSSLLASLHNHQPNHHHSKPNHNHNMIQVYSFCPPWEWQGDDAPSMNHFITESLISTTQHSGTVSDSAADEDIHIDTHSSSTSANAKTEWQLLFPNRSKEIDESTSRPSSNTSSDNSSSSQVPLWNFNYFFVNKTLKRIVFFTCVETMNRIPNLHMDPQDVSHEEPLAHVTANLTPASSSRSTRLVSHDFSNYTTIRPSNHRTSSTSAALATSQRGFGMMSPSTLQSAITDTASFAGYYSVTDDDDNDTLHPIQDEDEDEDDEGLDNDYDVDEDGPSKHFYMDDYDMDGDAMGQEAPPLTVI